MGKRGIELATLAAVLAFAAGACGSSVATPTPRAAPTTSSVPAAITVVRWFVGLGKGNDAAQVDAEKAFVSNYNASHASIYINLEIVPSASAAATLRADIANNLPPDIVGPVGVADRNGFDGDFVDLAPLIARIGLDTTAYPATLIDYFRQPDGTQIGLPYLLYPGFIFYNKDIFARDGLPDLPKKVGDQWNGQDWNWDTLSTLAAQLTRDMAGKKSTDAGFDPKNILQYGMDFPWADARTMASSWGAGTLVGPDGKAAIPDAWTAAWTWYYNSIWKSHIAPTSRVADSAAMNSSSTIASGRVAMALSWPWAISTYGALDVTGRPPALASWDIAVMPTYNGATSSPIDADTFCIVRGSAHPDTAFEAMVAIMADKTLRAAYGGMPAAAGDQTDWFTQMDASVARVFPNNPISWSVLQDMENYPASPSQEANLPNRAAVTSLLDAFYARLRGTDKLNIGSEILTLQRQIQRSFDQVPATPGS